MTALWFLDFGSGSAMLIVAWLVGSWLYRYSRSHPKSVFVNDSVLADMICVGEVFLLVFGFMLLVRGFAIFI